MNQQQRVTNNKTKEIITNVINLNDDYIVCLHHFSHIIELHKSGCVSQTVPTTLNVRQINVINWKG
jgi:hypothetical protein